MSDAAYMRAYLARLKKIAFSEMGGRCLGCGWTDERALQVDHVHGGGARRHDRNDGAAFYRRVIDSLARGEGKYQLLCSNCNWIKRHEREEGR